MATRDDDGFDRSAAARVLAEAARLSAENPADVLTRLQLLQAAAEVGIPRWAVDRAMATERRGLLVLGDAGAYLTRARYTPRRPEVVRQTLRAELVRRSLIPLETQDQVERWEQRSGWWPDSHKVAGTVPVWAAVTPQGWGSTVTLATEIRPVRLRTAATGAGIVGFAAGALAVSAPFITVPLALVAGSVALRSGVPAAARRRLAAIASQFDRLLAAVAASPSGVT